MSLAEDVRPSSRTRPSMCWKIRNSRRSDTAEIMSGTGDHQSPLVGGVRSILEPHRAFAFVITELSVMEQRYQAVLEVEAGILVVEVAHRFGVPAIHRWMTRYRSGGLEALADRSKRPKSSPWQMSGEVEALVCQLRRELSRRGARRLRAEPGRPGRLGV
jgi:transposase-like protein